MRAPWLALALLLAPASALAHPLQDVRTPVEWSDAPCMTIIDRSQDPVYPLEYDIPLEDAPILEDEPLDSHTHQFLGFCRDHHLDELLPNWLSEADLEDSVMFGLGTIDTVDLELHVLDNAPHWADCFTRISADDERRPITFEVAADPVLWDTSVLAAGTWVVEGYTYEPWYNLWSPHPGVFKVVDDPDPAASPPAAALTFTEQTVFVDAQIDLTGCVDAMDGSTMTLSWARAGTGDPQWTVFETELPVQNGSFSLPFFAPAEAAGHPMLIKLDVRDPIDRAWTAHARALIGVISSLGGGGDSDDSDDTGDDTETEGGDTGSDETGPTLDDNESAGCGCSTDNEDDGPIWALSALLLLALRPRRPCVQM
ncbi:hypothetical protein ENSA5_05400 [Enhygromyxa salina]|uniref:MYXO-CTERM domain-containing protein n=1 Tax=Enhygromyxa salina TaxID=215803 RepID=A0A2S9YI32_9BACT|nr:MYXO-CTERM sorting domain-containing protein [Enhygromyxa salina]PRQ04775.1 hypothetical protein ENSA5_05400 [Enhygromyxa salina]